MIEGNEFKPFSYEMNNYTTYLPSKENDTKEDNKNIKHNIEFVPFSKKKVDVPEHNENKNKYSKIENFGNASAEATSNVLVFISVSLVVICFMFLIRYIELLSGGCPISVFEIFIGRCGKRI
jgi:hypothetical protein